MYARSSSVPAVGRGAPSSRRAQTGPRDRARVRGQERHAREVARQHGPRPLSGCDQRRDAAVAHDRRRARGRAHRIDRHVGGAEAEGALHHRDGLGRLVQPDGDPVAAADPQLGEPACRPVREGVELAVAELLVLVLDRRAVRVALGRIGDETLEPHSPRPRAMRSRWISDVPEKMVLGIASRRAEATPVSGLIPTRRRSGSRPGRSGRRPR